jgi:DNA helicase-2/ATP-dependent DNA helicase PcrA
MRPIRTSLTPSLQGYLNRISLQTRDELSEDDQASEVNLMTIHAAKGLEFDIVFLAGVEQGILPHQRSVDENDGNVEEERRLFYVAITRARQRLYMTSCRRRQVQNETIESSPSPFLEEIPPELLEKTGTDPAAGIAVPEDPFAALKSRFGTEAPGVVSGAGDLACAAAPPARPPGATLRPSRSPRPVAKPYSTTPFLRITLA